MVDFQRRMNQGMGYARALGVKRSALLAGLVGGGSFLINKFGLNEISDNAGEVAEQLGRGTLEGARIVESIGNGVIKGIKDGISLSSSITSSAGQLIKDSTSAIGNGVKEILGQDVSPEQKIATLSNMVEQIRNTELGQDETIRKILEKIGGIEKTLSAGLQQAVEKTAGLVDKAVDMKGNVFDRAEVIKGQIEQVTKAPVEKLINDIEEIVIMESENNKPEPVAKDQAKSTPRILITPNRPRPEQVRTDIAMKLATDTVIKALDETRRLPRERQQIILDQDDEDLFDNIEPDNYIRRVQNANASRIYLKNIFNTRTRRPIIKF